MPRVVFEMETSDPDDFMTLLWLADHPEVELLAVLVTPGSADQCQLVRWGLDHCGRSDVPIGALHGSSWWASTEGRKPRVSGFHYDVYGEGIRSHPLGEVARGPALLGSLLQAHADVRVLVGSAPKNLGATFREHAEIGLACWVQQGGFAGDNLVPEPLAKFAGRLTCPSFNPGGAPKDTLALLGDPRIVARRFVSKNVCHAVIWTRELHEQLDRRTSGPRRRGLETMIMALDRYLIDKGVGKAMHDLVAAACMLDERVCEFVEVEIYREKGEWGARALPDSPTRISIGFDEARFLDVLAS
jgi:hypothetical protein